MVIFIIAVALVITFLFFILVSQRSSHGRLPVARPPRPPKTSPKASKTHPPRPLSPTSPLPPPPPPKLTSTQSAQPRRQTTPTQASPALKQCKNNSIVSHPFLPDYQILYTDRQGLNTERIITISRIEGDMIHAYCHLRHAKRCFYISRITQWTNCSTGEILADIQADFKAAREQSPYGLLDKIFDNFYPVISILLYLGKGNRRLMIDQRNVIIQVCQTFYPDPRLTDEMINDRINDMKVPSPSRYQRLVTELSGMDTEIQSLVLHAANRLFASRKTLNSTEKEGLEVLKKTLLSQGNPS